MPIFVRTGPVKISNNILTLNYQVSYWKHKILHHTAIEPQNKNYDLASPQRSNTTGNCEKTSSLVVTRENKENKRNIDRVSPINDFIKTNTIGKNHSSQHHSRADRFLSLPYLYLFSLIMLNYQLHCYKNNTLLSY